MARLRRRDATVTIYNCRNYRDLKRGTLDLTVADRDAVGGLLRGKATRVSALFGDPEQRDQALLQLSGSRK